MNISTMPLAQYLPIDKWQPQVGDFIVHHGWLFHWYGVVSSLNVRNYTVEVIQAGLPFLLFTMTPSDMEKRKRTVDIGKVTSSRGGKYAIQQRNGTSYVWFV